MEKTERKWSARITDGRTIGRKCAFVVGLHNDSAYEDCIASIELNHKEDADGWFEKYCKIAECMNAHSELQAKAEAYDRLMSGQVSRQELANIIQKPIASSYASNWWFVFSKKPEQKEVSWVGEGMEFIPFVLSSHITDGTKNWQASLTLPDGWEEV